MSQPISAPAPAPEALWAISPNAFNEWRATNDLPILFDFLAGLLPGFDDWQASLPFGRETVLRVVPTGELFKGASLKTLVRREDDIAGDFHLECVDGSKASVLAGARHRQFEAVAEFLPYFAWAKKHLGRARFLVWDKANDQRSDTFVYGSWRGQQLGGGPVTDTHATLFRGLDVLKLGETTISHVDMARNLDFTDLDGLLVNGDYSGSRWKKISFSSCKDVRFVDAHPVPSFRKEC